MIFAHEKGITFNQLCEEAIKSKLKDIEDEDNEVEIMGTTHLTYFIDAESEDDAVDRAMDEVNADWEIPKVWKLNAELSFVKNKKK